MTSWFLLQAFLLLLGGLASAQNEQDELRAASSRWQGFNSDAYYFEIETTFESKPVSFGVQVRDNTVTDVESLEFMDVDDTIVISMPTI